MSTNLQQRQVFSSDRNVLEAARERIAAVFDDFENICVSISGGKDSTVLAHLAGAEAKRRGRKIKVFFLDEEVDYQNTIKQVQHILFEMYPDNIVPVWFQLPFHLTNATSLTESQLVAWEPGKSSVWMRRKDKRAIKHWPYEGKLKIANKVKGFGFYDVIGNFEANQERSCFFVGLRADESLHRWRAVTRNPGHKDWCWTTKAEGEGNIKAYPLYDWSFMDVWRYIHDEKLQYNKIYDWMYKRGVPLLEMRISSLIHERSFKAICELPEFEPDTYDKLVRRIKGIATANLYGKTPQLLRCNKRPKAYKTWAEYRDFLLATYPDKDKRPIFEKRFAKHLQNEYVARQQCRQIMLNDYENNLPIDNSVGAREETIRKWMAVL